MDACQEIAWTKASHFQLENMSRKHECHEYCSVVPNLNDPDDNIRCSRICGLTVDFDLVGFSCQPTD
mgnify:CR=1 FL=1